MFTLSSDVRSFCGFLGASVIGAGCYALSKSAEKAERLVHLKSAYSALVALRIGYEFAKRDRPFTGTIVGMAGGLALSDTLRKATPSATKAFFATAMIVAFAVEWLTKSRVIDSVNFQITPEDPNLPIRRFNMRLFSENQVTAAPVPVPAPEAAAAPAAPAEASAPGAAEAPAAVVQSAAPEMPAA